MASRQSMKITDTPDGAECAHCHRTDPAKGLERVRGTDTYRCSNAMDCASIVRRRLINAAINGED